MQVKFFSQETGAAIQYLEDEVNGFLDSISGASVRHVTLSASDIERVASVWYEKPEPRDVEQMSSAELRAVVGLEDAEPAG